MSNLYKIISLIRRASLRWAPRFKVMNRNKLERGKYKCELCDHVGVQKSLQVDHIEPVIPISGFDNWEGFITRLFCDEDGLQLICKSCHKNKSKKENQLRAEFKKNNID